jgi:hypothetical protein
VKMNLYVLLHIRKLLYLVLSPTPIFVLRQFVLVQLYTTITRTLYLCGEHDAHVCTH